MSALEYTIYEIRRGWRLSKVFLFVGMLAAAVVGGVFTHLDNNPFNQVTASALFVIWAVAFGLKAHQRYNAENYPEISKGRIDLEIGLLLVVATHAIVQISGGLTSVFYPSIFVLIAFLVVYTPGWVSLFLAAATMGMEISVVLFNPSQGPLSTALFHALFIAFFALPNLVFTRTEVTRLRRQARKKMQEAEEAVLSDARDFRLTAPAMGNSGAVSREEESSRLTRSAVGEVRRAMYHHADFLKRTMGLHSCLILWIDGTGESLRVLDCVSENDIPLARRISRKSGVVGAVIGGRAPLKLAGLKGAYPGLSYYVGLSGVTDFLGVPIIEGDSIRGMLCADRTDNRPFTDMDEENLASAVESVLRIVANERVVTQLQKAKSEQGKLLSASDALSRALSETEVVQAAFDAAGRIAPYDVAAVALVGRKGKQIIHKAVGEKADELINQTIAQGSSLAAAALKNKHYLPYRGEFDPSSQTLFNSKVQKQFSRMQSALVLPLVAGETAMGTLTLASMSPLAYDEEVRTTIQVMTNQLSAALLNAQMVRKLEEMATTDGLTKLPNRRVFNDELDKKMASAIRFNKNLSVILCDVDKFKGVNDTYGHQVGDNVLVSLGSTLDRLVVRDTDLPARYGGEEFVILCEETDTEGAYQLAERIRKDLEAQTFHTDQGPLKVTISMGISTYPHHGRDKTELVERSDEALYAAKKGGRNQVVTWSKTMTAAPK